MSIAYHKNRKHGHTKSGNNSITHNTWCSMKQRCSNPKLDSYQYYGARGIIVCDRWMEFKNFLIDMGTRPHGLTLDRINVNGNYEPGNCRWATSSEQASNKRIKAKIRIKRIKIKPEKISIRGKITRKSIIEEFRKFGCTYRDIGEYLSITKQRAHQILNQR